MYRMDAQANLRQGLRAHSDLTEAERRLLEGTGGFGASVEEARAVRHRESEELEEK